jgi:sugar (pentulose or hexulose) kinase
VNANVGTLSEDSTRVKPTRPRASSQLWVGIDLGTQGCRVAILAEDGAVLARSDSAIRSARFVDRRHEQDPEEWKLAVARAAREALRSVDTSAVAGLAICGTSGTFLVADSHGRPLTRLLMYDDARATDEELGRVRDAWLTCADRNGYEVQRSWALPKLAWVVDHVLGAAEGQLYFAPDVIASWLTGERVATDNTHALKAGFDPVRAVWPADAFAAAGLPTSVLPRVVRPGTEIGRVSSAGANATGFPVGTPVLAGLTDGCAGQVASGALHEDEWNTSLGTTLIFKGVSRRLLHDTSGAVYSHVHPDGGWLPGGASSSGGGAITSAFPTADLAALDRAAATRVPTRLVRYPLAKPGERFPFARDDAEPFMLGTPRDELDMFAAILQGVAFVERLGFAYLGSLGARVAGAISFTGGATRSELWTQLRADVLGRAARVPSSPDASVGVAIVAAAGRGSVTAASERMVRIDKVVEPRPSLTERYQTGYVMLVDELERRGYIGPELAASARAT